MGSSTCNLSIYHQMMMMTSTTGNTASSAFSSTESSSFDFDLNLLDCQQVPSFDFSGSSQYTDSQVPSPSSPYYDVIESSSPTMFNSPEKSCKRALDSEIECCSPSKRSKSRLFSSESLDNENDGTYKFVDDSFTSFSKNSLSSIRNKEPNKRELLESFEKDVKMEPVFSLAMEQLQRDIESTCSILRIHPDPRTWTREDAGKWMCWTMEQFGIVSSNSVFDSTGLQLLSLTEEDFLRRFPQGGDLLYAQMDIWQSSASLEFVQEESIFDIAIVLQMLDSPDSSSPPPPPPPYSLAIQQICEKDDDDDNDDDDDKYEFEKRTQKQRNTKSKSSFIKDEEEETEEEETEEILLSSPQNPSSSSPPSSSPSSSSNIHLWQFVKELLCHPELYASIILWLDRSKGIFKIVDSVSVATLWGKRKNRPAMNYDKLSRSLRQYYKKGIMKKTERSQRLVYQFCSPYHM